MEVFEIVASDIPGNIALDLHCAILLAEVDSVGNSEPSVRQFDGSRNHSEIQRLKYGHSRAVHLRADPRGAGLQLLCNLAQARENEEAERLYLFGLEVGSEDGRLQATTSETPGSVWLDSFELPKREGSSPPESVYSLLSLDDDTFVAGLRGTAGRAKMLAFQVEDGA